MRLTTKGRFAVTAMIDLASRQTDGPVTLAGIADQAERAALYTKAQEIFKAEEPAMTLAHSKVFMPMNNRVKGYTMDPLGIHRFDNVDVE